MNDPRTSINASPTDKRSGIRLKGASVDRRTVLLGLGASAVGVALGRFFAPSALAEEVAKVVRWLEYSHIEKPYFYEPFTEKTGIKLVLGSISNDDTTLAMLKAGGTRDWDVFHMGDLKNHPILVRDKLIQPLDYSKIPNSKSILPVFQKFLDAHIKGPDGKTYGLPNRWGVDTLGYRTDKIDKPETMKVLWDEKYKGRISMPDYALYSIIYAAQYLDYPREDYYRLSRKQLEECKKALIAQKPLLKTYWLSDADVINLWTSGEIWIAGASWAGTIATLRDNKVPVARTVPKEPAFGFVNVAYISIDSPAPAVEASYRFLDYMIGPVFGERIGLQGRYATVTTLGQHDLPDNIKEQVFLKDIDRLGDIVHFMIPPTDPETNELNYDKWVAMWNEVKAA
jgi:spermidine/putrescine-binding protein